MDFSSLMSLFLYLVVGSVGMDLCVGCCNSFSALLYSSVSITTNEYPLICCQDHSCRIFLQFFNGLPFFLHDVRWGLYVFWMMVFTSPLNSSASPYCNLLHAYSIAATYSVTGRFLGTTIKFVPWANSFSCALVKGLLDILITHLFVVLV